MAQFHQLTSYLITNSNRFSRNFAKLCQRDKQLEPLNGVGARRKKNLKKARKTLRSPPPLFHPTFLYTQGLRIAFIVT